MALKKGFCAAMLAGVLMLAGGFSAAAAQTAPAADAKKAQTMVSISGMADAADGKICMVDTENHSVWLRLKKNDYVLLAGMPGNAGYTDGPLLQARFNLPWSVVSYGDGYLISDTGNNVIRRIEGDAVTTFAGRAKESGSADGKADAATFNRPTGLAVADDGTVYVADTGNHTIRAIDAEGNVTTFAGVAGAEGCENGTPAETRFCEPTGLFYKDGALYVADSGNHRICVVTGGKVKVAAGSASGEEGDAEGEAMQAALSNPQQVVKYKGALYIADTGNGCIKRLSDGKLVTILQANSRRQNRIPAEPRALLARNGYLYLGDMFAGDIYRIRL